MSLPRSHSEGVSSLKQLPCLCENPEPENDIGKLATGLSECDSQPVK